MGTFRRGWSVTGTFSSPIVRAGAILGLGLGGFFDGIVFHQIFQIHHMLSSHPDSTIAEDLQLNVLADGLFHLTTYLLTIVGIVLIVRAWRRSSVPPSTRSLFGAVLLGWGIFNLVEGLVNHHLLGLHRVWPAGPGSALVWDLLFLLWGVSMLAIGGVLVRKSPT